jgi:hypothetical protein
VQTRCGPWWSRPIRAASRVPTDGTRRNVTIVSRSRLVPFLHSREKRGRNRFGALGTNRAWQLQAVFGQGQGWPGRPVGDQ